MNQQMRTSDQERQSDSATFQVILKGLRADAPSEAREKLAALFKASLEQIDKLLAAPDYVVKKDISFAVASKYKSAIEAAGGACEVSSEEETAISIDVDLPSAGLLAEAENRGSSFGSGSPANPSNAATSLLHASVGVASTTSVDANPLKAAIENLDVLKHKISKNTAYLGVLVGMGIFAFSFFLSWTSIPAGQMARDGGSVTGWSEKAFLALLPLAFALYPVFLQKSVQLKNLLINIVIAFTLLGYNNVANRTTWNNHYGNMGSTLDVGFWIGLLAMVAISACGIAWSLHTTDRDEVLGELIPAPSREQHKDVVTSVSPQSMVRQSSSVPPNQVNFAMPKNEGGVQAEAKFSTQGASSGTKNSYRNYDEVPLYRKQCNRSAQPPIEPHEFMQ